MAFDRDAAPIAFQEVLASIAHARVRSDVALTEVPPPAHVAPFAVAVSGEIDHEEAIASGRFVALHDPDGQESWKGNLRVVCLIRAELEAEVGHDELWSQVAWSWLHEALSNVETTALGGTVTKVVNESFGELSGHNNSVNVELRVSWTPLSTDLAPHIEAWAELMAMCAGIPPVPDGVTMLPGRI